MRNRPPLTPELAAVMRRPGLRDRLRCLIGRHDYPDWPTWTHGGRGTYYRQRWCRRRGKQALETNG